MRVGDYLSVKIERITIGTGNKVYVSVSHESFLNRPTFYTLNTKVVETAIDRMTIAERERQKEVAKRAKE